jgi:hypothetical protein
VLDLDTRQLELRSDARGKLDAGIAQLRVAHRRAGCFAQDLEQHRLLLLELSPRDAGGPRHRSPLGMLWVRAFGPIHSSGR